MTTALTTTRRGAGRPDPDGEDRREREAPAGSSVVGDPSLHVAGSTVVLTLSGCVDRRSLPIVERVVDHVGCTGQDHLAVDLCGVDCLDEAGVRMLTALDCYMQARGGRLTVVGAAPSVAAALSGTVLAVQAVQAVVAGAPTRPGTAPAPTWPGRGGTSAN